MNNKCYFNSF